MTNPNPPTHLNYATQVGAYGSIPAPKTLSAILFSFRGRISRQTFWLSFLGIYACIFAAVFVLGAITNGSRNSPPDDTSPISSAIPSAETDRTAPAEMDRTAPRALAPRPPHNSAAAPPEARNTGIALVFLLPIYALAIWTSLAIQVKRWHDMDKSGWCVLFNLIPCAGIVIIVFLGFVRGTTGPNRFGDDPLISTRQ
jgi:uncharacterized membrane protein YhaH (DUF805 family)